MVLLGIPCCLDSLGCKTRMQRDPLPQFQTSWLSFCRAGTDPVKGIRGVQGPDQREATVFGLFSKQFMEHFSPSLRQKCSGDSLMHSSPALSVCPHHTQVVQDDCMDQSPSQEAGSG